MIRFLYFFVKKLKSQERFYNRFSSLVFCWIWQVFTKICFWSTFIIVDYFLDQSKSFLVLDLHAYSEKLSGAYWLIFAYSTKVFRQFQSSFRSVKTCWKKCRIHCLKNSKNQWISSRKLWKFMELMWLMRILDFLDGYYLQYLLHSLWLSAHFTRFMWQLLHLMGKFTQYEKPNEMQIVESLIKKTLHSVL